MLGTIGMPRYDNRTHQPNKMFPTPASRTLVAVTTNPVYRRFIGSPPSRQRLSSFRHSEAVDDHRTVLQRYR